MDSDRRQWKRKPVQLKIRYQSAGRNEEAQTHDISVGGVFIKTISPPPEGARIRLTFKLTDGYPIETDGTVMHRLAGVGAGVSFDPLSEEAAEHIRRFVDA